VKGKGKLERQAAILVCCGAQPSQILGCRVDNACIYAGGP